MIYIRTEHNKIIFTHYMPFDETFGMGKTESDLLKSGYLVDSVPEQPEEEVPEGKRPVLYYDGSAFWWEYEEVTSAKNSFEKRINVLEAEMAALLGTEEV